MSFYSGCWTDPPTLYHDKRGYRRHHTILAHRASFELHNGYLPPVVRHTCDNPPCYNPTHLLPGTHADNRQDQAERGNTPRPFGNKNTELNPDMPDCRVSWADYSRERRRRQKAGTWVTRRSA